MENSTIVTPIHKKGNKKLASNYRPVSLTSNTCTMMEKIMYTFIIDHIYENNYFSNFQHGFMIGRSTISPLLVLQPPIVIAITVILFCNYILKM